MNESAFSKSTSVASSAGDLFSANIISIRIFDTAIKVGTLFFGIFPARQKVPAAPARSRRNPRGPKPKSMRSDHAV